MLILEPTLISLILNSFCLTTILSASSWDTYCCKTTDTKVKSHNEELHTAERMGNSQVVKVIKRLIKLIRTIQRLELTQCVPQKESSLEITKNAKGKYCNDCINRKKQMCSSLLLWNKVYCLFSYETQMIAYKIIIVSHKYALENVAISKRDEYGLVYHDSSC